LPYNYETKLILTLPRLTYESYRS